MSEDEQAIDQENWFEPKMASIIGFMKRAKEWIAAAHISDQQKENAPLKRQLEAEDVLQDGVQADDSASQTGVHNPGSVCSTRVSRKPLNSRIESVSDPC
ncbi:hypothetical protein AAFF_G00010030 [Aldrovandia affinis]|uniref:Uncharacterized protein n=1 Tax=Aldrovandia affinis TaxID=143900 RepID=A0AAD7S747_9TELE|nr:hypothetical protein AAFF_G00010030 [Aldrovandia affinis]